MNTSDNTQSPKETETTAVEWTTVPELKGTKLGSLLADLKEMMDVKADAEARIEAIRGLISPLIQPLKTPVKFGTVGLRTGWVKPGTTQKLDRARLVQAGVTLEQIAAGTIIGTKKGYLKVDRIDLENPTVPAEPDSSETPSAG